MRPSDIRALKIFLYVLGAFAVLAFWFFIVPPGGNTKASARKSACLSNAKQEVFALLQYAADHDDRLPDRDEWLDAITPPLEADYAGRCPVIFDKEHPEMYGHAFNSLLSRKAVASIPLPETVPTVYDSLNLARNASDPLLSLPIPARHPGDPRKNAVAYLDGHGKQIPPGPPFRQPMPVTQPSSPTREEDGLRDDWFGPPPPR